MKAAGRNGESSETRDPSWGGSYFVGERHGGGSEQERKIEDPAVAVKHQLRSSTARRRGIADPEWLASPVAKVGYVDTGGAMHLSGQGHKRSRSSLVCHATPKTRQHSQLRASKCDYTVQCGIPGTDSCLATYALNHLSLTVFVVFNKIASLHIKHRCQGPLISPSSVSRGPGSGPEL